MDRILKTIESVVTALCIKILFVVLLAVSTNAWGQDMTGATVAGVTYVKIKNGIITFRKQIPSADIRQSIIDPLLGERSGYYEVRYAIQWTNGNPVATIKKTKTHSPAGKVWRTAAAFAIITGGLIGMFR